LSEYKSHEDRLRVVLHLPLKDDEQERAVMEVTKYIQQRCQDESSGVEGYTASQLWPPIFSGYWWDKGQSFDDRIVIYLLDFKISPGVAPSQEIRKLKEEIADLYKRLSVREEEVWVVAHQVIRYA
jgi:hypothetical protein